MLKTIDNSEESSVLSYATGMLDRLMAHHNEACLSMTAQEAKAWRASRFSSRIKRCHQEMNRAKRIALRNYVGRGKWTVELKPDAVVTDSIGTVKEGVIYWPTSLNRNNEGSVQSFLLQADHKLLNRGRDESHPNRVVVKEALDIAQMKSITNPPFPLDVEDIPDGS